MDLEHRLVKRVLRSLDQSLLLHRPEDDHHRLRAHQAGTCELGTGDPWPVPELCQGHVLGERQPDSLNGCTLRSKQSLLAALEQLAKALVGRGGIAGAAHGFQGRTWPNRTSSPYRPASKREPTQAPPFAAQDRSLSIDAGPFRSERPDIRTCPFAGKSW